MAFSEKPKKALFPLILLFVLTAALLFFFRPRTFDLSRPIPLSSNQAPPAKK